MVYTTWSKRNLRRVVNTHNLKGIYNMRMLLTLDFGVVTTPILKGIYNDEYIFTEDV